jgi:hypothetical protein
MSHSTWLAAAAGVFLLTLPLSAGAQPQAPMQAPATAYTDAQLNDFARATIELNQLHRGLGDNPSQAQREQASQAASAILQRYNLDVPTYNEIVTHARADEALAQRIRGMLTRESAD